MAGAVVVPRRTCVDQLDEQFSHRYDEWSAGMTADVPFYVELARQAKGPIVELAVGNGRVAVPVAQATGRTVVGIDSSPAMIDQARIKASAAQVDLISAWATCAMSSLKSRPG